MLVSIVIVALYIIILKWIENPIIDNIRKSKEISEIIYNRQKLKKIRKGSLLIPLVMCVLLHVFYKIYFSLAWWDMELIKSLFWAIFGCYIALRVRKDHNPLGTLSVLSKDDVVNSGKDYVLFLRGFDKDDYTPKAKIKKYQRHYSYFSEYHFTKIFKRYIDIYAVGMTQEIEAPTGAKRVYLSDIEWKKDVYDLMQSSKLIVVLVNDRSSCIWEIEKSATMLDKTIYIVDEEDKYERVRLQLQSIVKLPQLSNKVLLPIAIKLSSQSRTKIFSIEHSYKSYKKLLRYY